MTKIDIISGFLGAGKTTLIKKLLAEAFGGEKLVLIENEFGEIGIDGGFFVEKFTEILHVHLTFFRVNHDRKTIKFNIRRIYTLDSLNHIRKLPNSGRLDHNAVRGKFFKHLG